VYECSRLTCTLQTERYSRIYRFIPKSLYRLCIIDWFVVRPVEIVFANALGKKSAVEELRFRLFPGVYHPFTSEVFSKGLRNDSSEHVGQTIGLSEFRDLQSNIVDEHRDPEAVQVKALENVSDLQQGHSTLTAQSFYLLRSDNPSDSTRDAITAYRRASSWWQHVTGIVFLLIFAGLGVNAVLKEFNRWTRLPSVIRQGPPDRSVP
jgi:hypothetical protein